MHPPYQITPEILRLATIIAEKIGRINADYLDKPSPQLRKENRIKTIHSSLSIEGNTLTEAQITAILEQKRVIGPQKDIQEVMNAIHVYEQLRSFQPDSTTSFLSAHKLLMKDLMSDAGKYRKTGVGIMAGNKLAHMAPPADQVPFLMQHLFSYLNSTDEISLIKSCVFHYEMEFIHPFIDGNGRMGRLWQTLILLQEYPVFEFLPFENLIHRTQNNYYKALGESDSIGNSTPFITYMLGVINQSLAELLDYNNRTMSAEDRLAYFCETTRSTFTRKDYMDVFKDISTATASRDLKLGVEKGLFGKFGDKSNTLYNLKNQH